MTLKKLFFLSIYLIATLAFINHEWIIFENANFKILFPIKPKSDTIIKQTPGGSLISYSHFYQTPENSTDSNLLYGFTEILYPPAFQKATTSPNFEKDFFKGLIESAVKTVNGKLISEKQWNYKGNYGREIIIIYGEDLAIIKTKFLLVNNRSYTIQTVSSAGKEKNENSFRFFDSFELK